MDRKLLIVEVAALGQELLVRHRRTDLAGLAFRPMETVFPAVTCTVQASFRTASLPAAHGMIANGLFFRDLRRVMFWEQSAGLVAGERIWTDLRLRGGKVGLLFWQQSLGESADTIVSPAPVHKHRGGMIEAYYTKPAELLFPFLAGGTDIPGAFRMRHYWGPMASHKAGLWIALATTSVISDPPWAPDLCLTYLPTLDYDLQRYGPEHPRAAVALDKLAEQLSLLVRRARDCRYEVVVFGDYAMSQVTQPPVFPNLALRRAGLFSTREVRGRLYPDLYGSRAVAVADHQIAHVYVRETADIAAARQVLEDLPGVAEVLDRGQMVWRGLGHANAGELLAVAEEGSWLAYPWWTERRQAPDYAAHVDIHNKPGYDPCELFLDLLAWPPMSVSQDAGRVKGTHGRVGAGHEIAWASTADFGRPNTVIELAAAVRDRLGGAASTRDGNRPA